MVLGLSFDYIHIANLSGNRFSSFTNIVTTPSNTVTVVSAIPYADLIQDTAGAGLYFQYNVTPYYSIGFRALCNASQVLLRLPGASAANYQTSWGGIMVTSSLFARITVAPRHSLVFEFWFYGLGGNSPANINYGTYGIYNLSSGLPNCNNSSLGEGYEYEF